MKIKVYILSLAAIGTIAHLQGIDSSKNTRELVELAKKFSEETNPESAKEYFYKILEKIQSYSNEYGTLNHIYNPEYARPDTVDSTGQSALHWLALGNNPFYDPSATYTGPNDYERGVLSTEDTRFQRLENALDSVKNLNVNVLNKQHETPLYRAVNSSNWSAHNIAYYFIKKGADVNIPDANGNTPLAIAIKNNDLTMIKNLLEGGANTKIKNRRGEDALSIAQDQSSYMVAGAIQEWRKNHPDEPKESWSDWAYRNLTATTGGFLAVLPANLPY